MHSFQPGPGESAFFTVGCIVCSIPVRTLHQETVCSDDLINDQENGGLLVARSYVSKTEGQLEIPMEQTFIYPIEASVHALVDNHKRYTEIQRNINRRKSSKTGFRLKGSACYIPGYLMCQKHDKVLIFCHAAKSSH